MDHLKINKHFDPDLMISIPEQQSVSKFISKNYFSIQVGISNFDMFRTNYYLFINPKNLYIYYNDFFDESGGKLITLQQWRKWRHKPGFYSNHRWKNERLIIIKH